LEIPLGPHLLLFEDTLGSSSPIDPPPPQNRSPSYNRNPIGIEAQCEGYNFSDILEAHPIENEHEIDNFKN